MTPILADANQPLSYIHNLTKADIIYQDVAQRNQVEIFKKNIDLFLKDKGYALLSLKARSIDARKSSKQVFSEARQQLERDFNIIDYKILEPYEKDHCFFIVNRKKQV